MTSCANTVLLPQPFRNRIGQRRPTILWWAEIFEQAGREFRLNVLDAWLYLDLTGVVQRDTRDGKHQHAHQAESGADPMPLAYASQPRQQRRRANQGKTLPVLCADIHWFLVWLVTSCPLINKTDAMPARADFMPEC